jgi:hypothetical protein
LFEVRLGETPEDFRMGAFCVIASEKNHNLLYLSVKGIDFQ